MIRILAFFLLMTSVPAQALLRPWPVDSAQRWAARQPWQIGANYLPADAGNSLEMWQRETFNPARIDRELALAENTGMRMMRVFLHDLAFQADPAGFLSRMNAFLTLADRHHLRILFVFFDSCWDPNPRAGAQRKPTPGVHNSMWVQSPGLAALKDAREYPRLEKYVRTVVRTFARDPRILGWDVWNEPDNLNGGSYHDPQEKIAFVEKLLPQVFDWARSEHPTQPLTSGVWNGHWESDAQLRPIEKIQIGLSDVVTFHLYEGPAPFQKAVQSLRRFGRPIFCTEYMARPLGSTVQTILPVARALGVGAFNWGFVAGKSQTFYPWDSWQHPYSKPPVIWFHDFFYPNGQPYNADEIRFMQDIHLSKSGISGGNKGGPRPGSREIPAGIGGR
jgi:hypothetical protein